MPYRDAEYPSTDSVSESEDDLPLESTEDDEFLDPGTSCCGTHVTAWQRLQLYWHDYSTPVYLGSGVICKVHQCVLRQSHPLMRVFVRVREEQEHKRNDLYGITRRRSFFDRAVSQIFPLPKGHSSKMANGNIDELVPSGNAETSSDKLNWLSEQAAQTPSVCLRGSISLQKRASLTQFASFAANSTTFSRAMVQSISDEVCDMINIQRKKTTHQLNLEQLQLVMKWMNFKTLMLSTGVGPVVGGSLLTSGEDIRGKDSAEIKASLTKVIQAMKNGTLPAVTAGTSWVEFDQGNTDDDTENMDTLLNVNIQGTTRMFASVSYLAKTVLTMAKISNEHAVIGSRRNFSSSRKITNTFGSTLGLNGAFSSRSTFPGAESPKHDIIRAAIKICPLLDAKTSEKLQGEIYRITQKLKSSTRYNRSFLETRREILRRHRAKLGVAFEDLLREVIILQRCEHENVIRVFEHFKCSRFLYVAFQYCFGSLDESPLTANGLGDNKLCTSIINSVASALKFIHSREIVHRDIKPRNIFFNSPSRREVVLADFGISCLLSEVPPTICGSPAFLAPEVWVWKVFHYTSDMWALGLTYLFLLTGKFTLHYEENGGKSARVMRLRQLKEDQGTSWDGGLIPKFRDQNVTLLVGDLCSRVMHTESLQIVHKVSPTKSKRSLYRMPSSDSNAESEHSWESLQWECDGKNPKPSKEARSLIYNSLFRDPAERITAANFLEHPAMKKYDEL